MAACTPVHAYVLDSLNLNFPFGDLEGLAFSVPAASWAASEVFNCILVGKSIWFVEFSVKDGLVSGHFFSGHLSLLQLPQHMAQVGHFCQESQKAKTCVAVEIMFPSG